MLAAQDKNTSDQYNAAPNMALLEVGDIFNGRYEVVRCIKVGGMGAVYEVIHLQTKKRRALKVMLPTLWQQAGVRSRFKAEATIVADVDSDHIADVIDAGVDEATGSPFIAMELLRGEELGAMLERVGKLPAQDVVLYLSHAAYGLERTHAEGIIHRDLKPANLFVTYRDDGSPRVKLLDFGIAKVLGDTGNNTRGILGTPLFISPEQVHGERPVSPRTDVYALAHIAYHLLTGEPYWTPEESEAETVMPFLVKVMKGRLEPATERALQRRGVRLPPDFDAWFDKATAVDPDERHDSALALVTDLAAVLGVAMRPGQRLSGAPPVPEVPVPPITDVASSSEPRRSTVARAAILGATLVVAAIGLALVIRRGVESSVPTAAAAVEPVRAGADPLTISTSGPDTEPARPGTARLPVTDDAQAPANEPRVALAPTEPTPKPRSSIPAPKPAPSAALAQRPSASSSTAPPPASAPPSATGWRPPVIER